jgi:molybdopterin-guanine dinucleotide biosynthesis protein A
MKAREHPVGILLAGGKSSRMGGGDKCLLPLGGRPILAHVIERLKPQVAELIISANGDPARFSAFGLPVVEDGLGGYAGPLAGILAGLEWARINRPESRFAITAASDTPFLPADLVSRLCSASGEGAPDLAVARSADGMHPVFGLWPISVAPDLEASLISGDRKVSEWVEQHQAKKVMFPPVKIEGRTIDPFFNVNRPDDLAAAEAFLQTSAV